MLVKLLRRNQELTLQIDVTKFNLLETSVNTLYGIGNHKLANTALNTCDKSHSTVKYD